MSNIIELDLFIKMLSQDHRRIIYRAIAELERKIRQTETKEAQISEKIRQKNALDDLDRFTLATKRIVLAAKREASQIALVKLRSNMAPVRALPMELLTEIFLLAVADQEEVRRSLHGTPLILDYHWNEYNEHRMTLRTLTVQEIISHVCQHWRDVSLAIPSLWQKLIFAVWVNDENGVEQRINETLLGRMEMWLSRTRNSPLDVTFWSHKTPVLDIWKVIRHLSPRFRALRIYDQNVNTIQEIVKSFPPMPLLESLHLGCKLKNDNSMWKANLQIFPNTNTFPLQELYVERVILPWAQLSLSHLTKLMIIGRKAQLRIPYAMLNFILKTVAPTLQHFVFQDQNKPNLSDEPYDSPLEFPVLTTMEVNITDVRFLVHWLKAFSLPALTRVYLDIHTETGTEFRSLLTAIAVPKSSRPGEQPRITFQRCEELTMGPCGRVTYGIGEFIGTAFPSLRKFHSHPEDSPFPTSQVLESFNTKCPHLVEVQAYRCRFVDLHRLINMRLLNMELTSLNTVVLETVADWSTTDINRVRERVHLIIGDCQTQQTDLMEFEDYRNDIMIEDDNLYGAGSALTHVSGTHVGPLNLSDNDAEMSASSSSEDDDDDDDDAIEHDWR